MAKSKTLEVVKEVRLSPSQRAALMCAAGNGDQVKGLTFEAQQNLRWLGLIEERLEYSGSARQDLERKIAAGWKALAAAVKAKMRGDASHALSDIGSWTHALERKGWFLSAAGREYLTVGRVTVIAGPKAEGKR